VLKKDLHITQVIYNLEMININWNLTMVIRGQTSLTEKIQKIPPFQSYPAFIGSGVFRKVNDFLRTKKIEW
jgi:hypothetical protein